MLPFAYPLGRSLESLAHRSAPDRGKPRLADPTEEPMTARADPAKQSALFASLYAELRQIARRELHGSGSAGALSPTTILHEAYLKLRQRPGAEAASEGEFLAYASLVMRNLVIDLFRQRQAVKRGGGFRITAVESVAAEKPAALADLESLAAAIDTLATLDQALAELVDLKFFCGFSFVEIAAVRGVSERTVQRDWQKARILLRRVLEGRDLLPD
jgi:RNA polymerase sigma factor (TIGR02999 family)